VRSTGGGQRLTLRTCAQKQARKRASPNPERCPPRPLRGHSPKRSLGETSSSALPQSATALWGSTCAAREGGSVNVANTSPLHPPQYQLQHPIQILINLIIRNPQHPPATTTKKRRPFSITPHRIIANMGRPIDLDRNLRLQAGKIDNEGTDRMLPPDPETTKSPAPHMGPQDHLCTRHGLSKFPTTGERAAFRHASV
jgi:hypothetical protein